MGSAGSMLEETSETYPAKKVAEYAQQKQKQQEQKQDESKNNNNNEMRFVLKRKTEKWYGVDYFMSSIDPVYVKRWEEGGSSGSSSTTTTADDNNSNIEWLNVHEQLY